MQSWYLEAPDEIKLYNKDIIDSLQRNDAAIVYDHKCGISGPQSIRCCFGIYSRGCTWYVIAIPKSEAISDCAQGECRTFKLYLSLWQGVSMCVIHAWCTLHVLINAT